MAIQFKATKIAPKEEKRWNNLLFSAINGSYRQGIPFEYAKEMNGREINTYIFQQDGKDIAGVHYSIKGKFKKFFSVADIMSGIAFIREPDQDLLTFIMNHFVNWAKNRKASYIRINPWLPKTIANKETIYKNRFDDVLKRFELNEISMGRHTYWIDLLQDEEQIFNKIKPQTRNKIRRGEKLHLIVEKHDKIGEYEKERFWKLYDELGKLKGFNTLSRDRFEEEIISMVNHGLASLFFTKFNNMVVNVAVVSTFGESNYYYGAINPNYKSIENCPSPGPYSQWSIIMTMKSIGIKTYDMGFAPGPVPIKSHPRYSIWRYKYDFGGDHVEFLPTYGKAINPIRGKIFQYWRYKK